MKEANIDPDYELEKHKTNPQQKADWFANQLQMKVHTNIVTGSFSKCGPLCPTRNRLVKARWQSSVENKRSDSVPSLTSQIIGSLMFLFTALNWMVLWQSYRGDSDATEARKKATVPRGLNRSGCSVMDAGYAPLFPPLHPSSLALSQRY